MAFFFLFDTTRVWRRGAVYIVKPLVSMYLEKLKMCEMMKFVILEHDFNDLASKFLLLHQISILLFFKLMPGRVLVGHVISLMCDFGFWRTILMSMRLRGAYYAAYCYFVLTVLLVGWL